MQPRKSRARNALSAVIGRGRALGAMSALLLGCAAGTIVGPAEAAAPATPAVLRVGSLSPALPVYWGFYVAQDLGYFKAENLDIQLIKINNDADCIRALTSDSLDACTSGIDAVVHAADAKANVRIVAGLLDKNPTVLVGRPGMKQVSELRGKRIAVFNPEEGSTLAMFALLAEAGVKRTEFDTISVGGGGPRYAALKAGQADATMLPPPNAFIALDNGFSRLASAASPGAAYGTVMIAMPGRNAATDQSLARMVSAVRRANAWLVNPQNRAAAIDLATKGSLKIPPQYAERTYALIVEEASGIAKDATPSLDTVRNVIRLMETYTKSRAKNDAAYYIDTRYLK